MKIKGALHVQSWCFVHQTYCLFDVLVAVSVVESYFPSNSPVSSSL